MIERKCFKLAIILLGVVAISCASPGPVAAQDQQQSTGTPYSIQEYNAFQACRAETDPTAQIKCLDDFVAKFPNSTLMQYVYQLYYPAYYKLKNYKKAVEYADKLAAMGDKIDAGTRLSALQTHCQLFQYVVDLKAPDAHDGMIKVRDSCLAAVSILKTLKKPDNISEEDFQKQVKQTIATDAGTTGFVDLQLKDYAAAIEQFKLALDNNPADAVSEYRIGVAELALTPPQSLDGFWALARSINMNVPDAAKIQTYLRQQMLTYESPGCDSQVDDQLKELLGLTKSPGDRPATWTIPTSDDLHKISQASNILTVISDLSGGGDKAKMTWLALCGAEFPEVVGKIIDSQQNPDGSMDFHVFTAETQDEMQAATTANMDVKVWVTAPANPPAGAQITPQPDVVRLQKDDGIRFSGTLASYDPSPFMLHWDQVKVDPTIIPEKTETGKHPHKVPPKKSQK